MVAFPFTPRGWVPCDGRLLSVQQFSALYSLISTTYGGDGVSTFAVPDYRVRTPVGLGTSSGLGTVTAGQTGGAVYTTLSQASMPMHSHSLIVGGTPVEPVASPSGSHPYLSASGGGPGTATIWSTALQNPEQVGAGQVGASGGSTPVDIRNPFLGTNFILCVDGIFPDRD